MFYTVNFPILILDLIIGANMTEQAALLEKIPTRISNSEIVTLVNKININWKYLRLFKEYTSVKDDTISDWLNINVRTLRNYRKYEINFKDNIKEQLILLFSLFKHGSEVFGNVEDFSNWLHSENFFFDKKAPVSYLNTETGIRLVDDRLTAMEYGDNV